MSKQTKSSFWRKFCKSCKLENQQVRWNQWVEDERIPLPPPAHQKHPRWSTACALRPIPAVSLALGLRPPEKVFLKHCHFKMFWAILSHAGLSSPPCPSAQTAPG